MQSDAVVGDLTEAASAVAALAEIYREFGLHHVAWESGAVGVTLSRGKHPIEAGGGAPISFARAETSASASGTPVPSPMTGIFYDAPSPSAKPFVREGDAVTAGQVIGLIEAMKVYSDIVSPVAGTVLKVVAKGGDVVNPGDPLIYVG